MDEHFSSRPVRRIEEHRLAPLSKDVWPATIPAVRQILDEGLDLSRLTVFVGENGTGKSTIVEALAQAFGLNAEGGTQNALHHTQRTESTLAEHLQLTRGAGGSKKGVFLRAETMHSHFAYLDSVGQSGRHNFQSHGESFLEFVVSRSGIRGLWVFDEAESALSFNSSLTFLSVVTDLVHDGSQVVISTHSPIFASLPEACLYEAGEWGLRRRRYDELELTQSWRLFLEAPERFLRYLGS